MVRVMIRSASLRLFLSASLLLGLAVAEASAQQQKPGAGSSSRDKPAAGATQGKVQAAAKGKAGSQGAAPQTSNAPGGGQATLLESYGDLAVYTAPGRSKVCYALAQPKSRFPSTLKDVKGYMFVATRPAEKVRNEISLIMNFDLKEGAEHQAVIGQTQFNLVAKGKNLWVKNPAEEGKVVDAMKRANDLTVKSVSARNNNTADKYSLKGFGDALDRVHKECR